ncbi:hypothetical protein [Psychromonas aquimarina]|uniref:hypothetical protein n=1 Tax=Psychromonas aquimarina TaxID=444919 RepID=UPI0003FE087A|nr:hypothetical protein [Psychromonas aquimarina]
MPHKVDISCPSCGGHAVFEFAEVVKITLKKDVQFFEQSELFDYYMFKDSCGHKRHGAVYYANLHGGSTSAISDLPEGYQSENWKHSKYLIRSHGTDLGAFCCAHCQARERYILQWPDDAYYSINYKGETLWAFNRESSIDLRDYIASKLRKTENYKWANFLLHVPAVFKKQNARDKVVKQINRLLTR